MSINNISINQNSKEEKEIKKKKVCLCYRHAYLFVFCGSVCQQLSTFSINTTALTNFLDIDACLLTNIKVVQRVSVEYLRDRLSALLYTASVPQRQYKEWVNPSLPQITITNGSSEAFHSILPTKWHFLTSLVSDKQLGTMGDSTNTAWLVWE